MNLLHTLHCKHFKYNSTRGTNNPSKLSRRARFWGGGRWWKAEEVGNLEIKQSRSISEVGEGGGRQRQHRGGRKPRNQAVALDFGGGGRWWKAEEVGNLEIEQSHSISEVVEGGRRQKAEEV